MRNPDKKVERHDWIEIEAYDALRDKPIKKEFDGATGIIVQIALDHLDGVLFVDKWKGLIVSEISQFLERIPMEHIESIYSLESKLQIYFIRSIRIFNILEVIAKCATLFKVFLTLSELIFGGKIGSTVTHLASMDTWRDHMVWGLRDKIPEKKYLALSLQPANLASISQSDKEWTIHF